MGDYKCPKCSNFMMQSGVTISGNSKYMNYECEVCNHKEMKCLGLIQ